MPLGLLSGRLGGVVFVTSAVLVITYIAIERECERKILPVVSRKVSPYGDYGLPKEKMYVKTPWDRRNCTLGNKKCRKVLLMGAGYSGTGFFSKVFTEIGCNVGHECMDTYGVSDWRRSFEQIDGQIFFTHKFVQVRHPLQHVRSWRGTKWGFAIASWYNCSPHKSLTKSVSPQEQVEGPTLRFQDFTNLQNITVWNLLPGEVKMLDYWVAANMRALFSANMWWKLDNVDKNLYHDLCIHISCPNCNISQISRVLESKAGHNAHRKEDKMPEWDEVCHLGGDESNVNVQSAIQTICDRARALCSSLQFENC